MKEIFKEMLGGALWAVGIVAGVIGVIIGMNILALYMTYLFLERL